MLGLLWTVIHPLLLLAIYTFVFSAILRAKWALPGGGEAQFPLVLFSGLILYTIFADCVRQAPDLMVANATYLKQLIFPVEILVWVTLLSALFDFAVGSILLSGFYVGMNGAPPLTWAYLPVVLVPVLLITLGLSWLLASLGVFFRDLSQIVGVLTTALLFLSPVFYPASMVPERFQLYYQLNPFATLLEMSKGALFYGTAPDWSALGAWVLAGWIVAWLGHAWFMRTKREFADVL